MKITNYQVPKQNDLLTGCDRARGPGLDLNLKVIGLVTSPQFQFI